MRVHFFSRIDFPNRSSYYQYSTLQNLKAVKVLSIVYLIVSICLRLFIVVSDLPIESIKHISEFNISNWISMAVTPLFYLSSFLLLNYHEEHPSSQAVARAVTLLFALFIMITFMRVTFFAMYNPRNTLVMYLMGVTMVGVFFTFEYFESLFLVAVTGICFSLLIPYYQTETSELLLNNLASLVMLTVFFCLSRYSFSYRADNYLKLKAIEQKNREVQNAIQVKNEILGIVAHDLRNPLAAIKTLASFLKEEEKMDENDQENLQMIQSSCDKAAAIINDLLETAHDDQQHDFDVKRTELNQFLLKIVDEWVKSKHGQINILYYGNGQSIYAFINTEKMERVMDNLISNAIKFSGPSHHVEIALHVDDNRALIDVKDFGMGIPDHLLPFIFDRFSRASRKGMRGEESVGLGLSIVRQIINKHGGDIGVSTAEKKGTTFTISLEKVA